MPEREQLLAIRRHISESAAAPSTNNSAHSSPPRNSAPHSNESKATASPARPAASPRSPRHDLLLCRQWGISATLPAETATTPTLLKEIARRFRLAAPIVELLNQPLAAKPKKPLF